MQRQVRVWTRIAAIFVLSAGVFLLMKLLNDFTGYGADDYLYHFFYTGEWPAQHLRGIHNLLDLVQSVQNHTRIFNGRFVAHTGVMTAMQFSKSWFNFANSLVFVLVGWLINLHVFGKKPVRVSFLALTYALLWVALPDHGTTMLWLSGSFNYLWMALVYLLFLLPYRFNYHARYPRLMAVGMLLLGFLAGATNENTAPLTIFIAFACTLLDWQHAQLAWKWTGGIASAVGFYVMARSGANQIAVRGSQFQIHKLLNLTMRYSGWLLLVTALVALYLLWQHNGAGDALGWRNRRLYLTACLYALGAVLGIIALVVSPQILSRVFFGPNLYLIIALLMLLRDHSELRTGSAIAVLLPGLLALGIGFAGIPAYQTAVQSNYQSFRYWATGDQICRTAAKHGIKDVKVPGMPPVYTDLNMYKTTTYLAGGNPHKQWFNVWMAKYYHLDSVAVDNSIAPRPVAKPTHSLSWLLYRGLVDIHSALTQPWAGNPVAAASEMRTAYLHYVDQNGQQVGTEPISGNVGTRFDISHASVSGYTTDSGNPQSYVFTDLAAQSITVHVHRQAAAAHALLQYTLASGTVVAREPISGTVGQTIDISHAATAGYRTLAKAPASYRLTAAAKQTVTIPVVAQVQGLTIRYYHGQHLVKRVFVQVRTGKTFQIRAPFGYRLESGTAKTARMPAQTPGNMRVPVIPVHGWAKLRISVPFWAVIIGLLIVVWDQLAAYRLRKQ
ncbi:DUF6056 family protein [Lacticaseibacillus zhaodongensis]|uniref:DUF6056 family protein n=1 Tax=Lacticaseibacillus zhaodongensis TaxID=2668065 RepID=UPI0018AFC0D0|nr:DUF6056 family protein [Lacticaseibacillus zhaodongensis]